MKSLTRESLFIVLTSLVLSLFLPLHAEDLESGAYILPSPENQSQATRLATSGGKIFHSTENQVSSLRTVFVPDSMTQIYLWDEELSNEHLQAFYAVSRNGLDLSGRVRATTYSIRLRDHTFDPLTAAQSVYPVLEARNSNRLFLVQFVATPLPEFRSAVTGLGGDVHRFLTDHTFLVEMSEDTHAQVAELPFVRWIGPYHPEYRVEEYLRDALTGTAGRLEEQRYSIMVCGRDHDRRISR